MKAAKLTTAALIKRVCALLREDSVLRNEADELARRGARITEGLDTFAGHTGLSEFAVGFVDALSKINAPSSAPPPGDNEGSDKET